MFFTVLELHIYPKYLNIWTTYHTCSKIWTSLFYYLIMCPKIAGWVKSCVDPDQTWHSVVSDLSLPQLLKPVFQITWGKYGIIVKNINVGFTQLRIMGKCKSLNLDGMAQSQNFNRGMCLTLLICGQAYHCSTSCFLLLCLLFSSSVLNCVWI